MPSKRDLRSNSSVALKVKKIDRNLKQQMRRIAKNNNPLKIGKNEHGKAIYIRGKSAKRERKRLAKANAQYQKDVATGLRPKHDGYTMTARNLNFSSRAQFDKTMKWRNATAQRQILSDRGNSFRQSFRTRAEDLGISAKVRQDFEERFSELNNDQLLQVLNQSMENSNITFDEVFSSDQPTDDFQDMKQLTNMYKVLGIEDKIQYLSFDDINSGLVDNSNFTHYDFNQDKKKAARRDKGRV